MRSKYETYPEYHTSLDDLTLVTPKGLAGSYTMLKRCLEILERNHVYRAVLACEPQLGKRGLYPTVSTRQSGMTVRTNMNVLAYADGDHDLIALADRIGADALECANIAERFAAEGLLESR
jgi:aminopeptidase-like protein